MLESGLRELEALNDGTIDSIYSGYDVARADEGTAWRPMVILSLGTKWLGHWRAASASSMHAVME